MKYTESNKSEKQTYEAPEMHIELFETEDVLNVSIVKNERGALTEISWNDL